MFKMIEGASEYVITSNSQQQIVVTLVIINLYFHKWEFSNFLKKCTF